MLIARILLLFMACNLAAFAAAQDGTETDDGLLVFIGEKISFKKTDFSKQQAEQNAAAEANGDRVVISSGFGEAKACYRVLAVLKGTLVEDEIDITISGHTVPHGIGGSEHALLYVRKTAAGYQHHHSAYDEVFPLKSGGFGGCGNAYLEYDFEERTKLAPVPLTAFDYVAPPQYALSDLLIPDGPAPSEGQEPYSAEELDDYQVDVWYTSMLAQAIYPPPVFEMMDASTLVCKMGLSPEALFDARWKARFLPNLRREECKEQLELDGYRDVKEREAKQPLLDACIADKIANDGRD